MTPLLNRRNFIGGALAATALSAWARPAAGRRKIDIHVHLGRDRKEMEQISRDNLAGAVKHLIAEMDRHQVEKSLIVAVEPQFPSDLYLEAAKLEPERLLAACSVVPRPANQAIDKLKSYRDRGAKALKLQPMQYDPADPALERVVAEAVRLGMPVLFHHTDTPKSFPETLSRFAATFPNGSFVVIHFGGVYGFWDVLPLARLPNVYLETSTAFARIVQSPLRGMLHFLADENRLDKLIFGSELPSDYEKVFSAIDELLGPAAREEVVKAVYKGNAEKILKLTVASRIGAGELEREKWQKISEVFSALGVREGSRVADVGAGGGFFTARLSRAVGSSGRVLAVDASERALRDLRKRVAEEELSNVEVIQGEDTDPKLPAAVLDGALMVDAYHEMPEHRQVLAALRKALKPGGRLVILDRVSAAARKAAVPRPRLRQTAEHEISLELVEADLRQAGFEILERRDPFTVRGSPEAGAPESTLWMVVARRPA